uniref:Uncharacterized protein n=1 Tax=Anopheles albimanus TaxID=7167 RepID=A0A182FYN0_ANOAL
MFCARKVECSVKTWIISIARTYRLPSLSPRRILIYFNIILKFSRDVTSDPF